MCFIILLTETFYFLVMILVGKTGKLSGIHISKSIYFMFIQKWALNKVIVLSVVQVNIKEDPRQEQ